MEQNQENETKEYLNELKKRQARKKEQILNNDLNTELNNNLNNEINKELNNKNQEKDKPINEPFNIKVNTKLKEQFNIIANNSKIKKVDLINEILREYFNKRVLTNDFLLFQKPYYFNIKELLKKHETKAKYKKPKANLFNYYIGYQIPINFNSWNNEYKTFCYNELNHHKGIIKQAFNINQDILLMFLIFEYQENELNIKAYNLNELKLIANPGTNQDIIINELIKDTKKEIEFNKTIGNTYINKLNKTLKLNAPIDNIANSNYEIYKPYYIYLLENKLINEIKANNKDIVSLNNMRYSLKDIEQALKPNIDFDYLLKENLYNYLKQEYKINKF